MKISLLVLSVVTAGTLGICDPCSPDSTPTAGLTAGSSVPASATRTLSATVATLKHAATVVES